MTPQDIIDFWFKQSTPEQWFKRNDAFDETIRTRFSGIHAQAKVGELDSWAQTPPGALALVIILDQFSRNMFRNSSESFASDAQALAIAKAAVANGLDAQLEPMMRKFLFMPFMHSESLLVQDEGLKLFAQLDDPETMDYAKQHRKVIARFGRFPHRNEVLGRESTAEEIEFMRAKRQL